MRAMLEQITNILAKLTKRKISNKLIVVSSLFFITSVILVCAVNYYYTSAELRKDYYLYNKKILHVISQNYENYIEQISSQSLAIRHDEILITSLASGDYSYEIENKLRLVSPSHMAELGIDKIEFFVPKTGKAFVVKGYNVKSQKNYLPRPESPNYQRH